MTYKWSCRKERECCKEQSSDLLHFQRSTNKQRVKSFELHFNHNPHFAKDFLKHDEFQRNGRVTRNKLSNLTLAQLGKQMDLDYLANQMTAWPVPVSWRGSAWPQNRTSAAEKSCEKSNEEESSVGASITNDVTAHLGQYTYTSLQLIIPGKSFCFTRVFDLPLQHALTHRNTKHFRCAPTKSNTPERGRESQNILLASGGVGWLGGGGGGCFLSKVLRSLETLTA